MAINLDSVAATVERYMIGTCVVRRVIGSNYDEITMKETPVFQTIYTGKCMLSPMGDPQGTRYGSEDVYRTQYELGLPRSAPESLPNDQVEILTSPNSAQVADDYYVHDSIRGMFFTHHRIKLFRDTAAT